MEEFSRLVLTLHTKCRDQPLGSFQDWALDLVRPLLGFDSALWLTGTLPADGGDATFHTHHLYRQPVQLLSDCLRAKDRSLYLRRAFATPGTPVAYAIADEFPPEFAADARRFGIEHALATACMDPVTSLGELIVLYRSDPQTPFDEGDILFQQCLAPHLTEACRINRLHQLTQWNADSPSLSVATADTRGILRLADPAFCGLMRDEWPHWHGVRLPAELASRLAAGTGRYAGEKIVVYFSPLRDMTLLRCRRKGRIDSLSERESEIAIHFASGRTHKEIARHFGLSPATVRNHLTATYVKLGVGSKAELIHLMREHA